MKINGPERYDNDGAYMTVEASIVFPLMIFAFAILIYLLLFTYNRALLSADSAMLSVYAAEAYRDDPEKFLKKTNDHFAVIRSERPYLSVSGLSASVSKKRNRISIDGSADLNIPIKNAVGNMYEIYDLSLKDQKEMTIVCPSTVMLITDDLTRE